MRWIYRSRKLTEQKESVEYIVPAPTKMGRNSEGIFFQVVNFVSQNIFGKQLTDKQLNSKFTLNIIKKWKWASTVAEEISIKQDPKYLDILSQNLANWEEFLSNRICGGGGYETKYTPYITWWTRSVARVFHSVLMNVTKLEFSFKNNLKKWKQ